MKKCPKCNAEIGEESRFCLYCMTSFEEKQTIETPKENNKRWLIIIAAVLALVLIVLGIFLLAQKESPNNRGNDTSSSSSVSSDLDASDDNTTSSEQQNSESRGNETSTPTSSNQTQTSSKNEGGTTNNNSGNTTTNNSTTNSNSQNNNTNNTINSTLNSTSTNSPSSSNKTETESSNNSSSSSTITTPSQTMVTYIYRDAVPADDYTASTTITNNAVVITGVKNISNSGIYEIPATIGGKKVVAIMDNAFCEDEIKDTVKQVIIPSTVKTINAYAFYKCYNLTDIYINGEAVACPSVIIPNKSNRNFEITIHASSACHDRNFHTYKTLSTYWEVNFKEWNG